MKGNGNIATHSPLTGALVILAMVAVNPDLKS